MPKLGRPKGPVKPGSITRSICIPAELYKKCIWIADYWTKDAMTEDFDGSQSPEYWSMPKVIASVLAEYFEALEASDPNLTKYFDLCRQRGNNLQR